MGNDMRAQVAPDDLIFAMDIGTRSIIGMVGVVRDERLRILAIEEEAHTKRAMLDGQIEDIGQVAAVGRIVKERLEKKLNRKLTKVCIAAAGRALKTQRSNYEMELAEPTRLDAEIIGNLESGALSKAEAEFRRSMDGQNTARFYMVGHTVVEYQVDGYPMSNLLDHKGKKIRADVVATFLPREVVESLYTTMKLVDLEVISMTLEPIAAMNAVIPANLRLLNLALVDIGAGTSDIAIARDGGIVGYTMATVAGDEITEALMKTYLLDFATAERMKAALGREESFSYTDVLGMQNTITSAELEACVSEPRKMLADEIARRVVEVNEGKAPSAVFLAGGGSKLSGLRECVSQALEMDLNRVAIAGNNFEQSAYSDDYVLNDSEYATPLGIAVSAAFDLISDSFRVTLNGKHAKLFRNGTLTVQELLVMNGYSIQDFLPRNGKNAVVQVNGKREIFRGESGKPAVLMLNGEKSRLTNIVRAGDVIEFTPATQGDDAHVTVGEAIGSARVMVTVNGEAVSPDRLVADGDVILSEQLDEVPTQTHAPHDTEEASVPQLTLVGGGAGQENDPAEENNGVEIMFNGLERSFPPKTDGEPYYLMNLLKYCDFPLDHPEGEVVLRINGKAGSFLDVVRSGDQVDIFCRAHEA
jgi:cell division protein FtsA